ncbi:MAG: DUF4230 domain-containing protein [Lactobacillus sp.]|jgi:hypothetical protein|uniref:DUF4230 domain-containing protein n=1 Tax=Lacticaseibacillus suilingensis TaxID=2799577 RepID=A0ABW4BCQ2_9LACO|nr:DUF4230 domain-containing protein [Lacticaseibacillus suilingensis]MCI1893812.1 DUF4230 domain-containing protein [Lactobacillus sp.]MCI1917828.1 DUF4230 domain-containing protein [Lactobacillus sp.]MCI1941681.1 DUF4230 domain-containing protein [Lactobacillus sp.]MCI1972227.1 DUF4230 domain-containing protein [Lactobacillus sp.]MCI2016903.1 DUF4230 domain-containing protein [Lactobacillus sp.]
MRSDEKSKKKKWTKARIIKWAISAGIVIVVLTLGIWKVKSLHFFDEKDTVSTSNYTVKNIGELDTTSVFYDKTVETSESGRFLGLKMGTEKSLYIFHFKAQVYYDLNKATSHYDEKSKTMTVNMPKPGVKLILKDDDSKATYQYYDLKDSVWVNDKNDKGLKLQAKLADTAKQDIMKKKISLRLQGKVPKPS